jgi:hypothetical protein
LPDAAFPQMKCKVGIPEPTHYEHSMPDPDGFCNCRRLDERINTSGQPTEPQHKTAIPRP